MCKFVDLHSHVLPGIDDGSPDMETSMKMLENACAVGVETIVCTSHIMPPQYNNSSKNIIPLTEKIIKEAHKKGISIDVRPGGEVYFTDKMAELFKNKSYPEYSPGMILVEFPMNEIPRYVEESFFQLELAGAEVVLAHPERNHGIMGNVSKARAIFDKGVHFLLNAGSITGSYGTQVHECAFELINQGLVTAIASDAHRPRAFSKLVQAREIIDEKYGKEASKLLFYTNPLNIIKGRPTRNFKPKQGTDGVQRKKPKRAVKRVFSVQ